MKLLLTILKFCKFCTWTLLLGSASVSLILVALAVVIVPSLPMPDYLKEVQLQTPLRIYTKDDKLIAEFGEQRRSPLSFEKIPDHFIFALLAAEDKNFYDHHGVDLKGLARATVELIRAGEKKSGGSTITMQVARNFFLTREQTFIRKFKEIFLALKIERAISKERIIELYVNKIYLGHRSYGIASAAKVYYDKALDELSLAELAMIAGLPKAPSSYNPITNPSRALVRRNWILERMAILGFITTQERDIARQAPITAEYHGLRSEINAPYLAEMVRKKMLNHFGSDTYSSGLVVRTTITAKNQVAANQSVQNGIIEYEERHGYRGPEGQVKLPTGIINHSTEKISSTIIDALADFSSIGPLKPALVLAVKKDKAIIGNKTGALDQLDFSEMDWAKPFKTVNHTGPTPKNATEVLAPGDIIRLREVTRVIQDPDSQDAELEQASENQLEPVLKSGNQNKWRLAQIPLAQAALVSLNPKDGAVEAIVGGFDFYQSKFNRATQAGRQAGSSFKPFIYTAALANGFTAASLINDAPIVLDDPSLETHWRPENSSGQFYGPTRLRRALYKSRNLVSIRLLRQLGVYKVLNYVTRFGYEKRKLPANLSLALGSASVTPMQIAESYTIFANGGYKVSPYYIESIEDTHGNRLYHAAPLIACRDCPEETTSEEITPEEMTLEEMTADKATSEAAPPSKSEIDFTTNNLLVKASEDTGIVRLAPRVEDERIIYIIRNMMQDVIKKGTGRKASALGRNDIAGKTGTTNDQIDAWFAGYNGDLVAAAWLGFDTPSSLGGREYGAKAALPIWMGYMKEALSGKPEFNYPMPPNIVSIKIDPDTGETAHPSDPDAFNEYFRIENVPERSSVEQDRTKTPYSDTFEPAVQSLDELF